MHKGAGITIINKIDESIIENRPIYQWIYGYANRKGPQQGPPEDAWKVAGEKANSKVNIKILFLAGLLDIINSINKELTTFDPTK